MCKEVCIGDTLATQHLTFSLHGDINKHTREVQMKQQVIDATTTVTLVDFLVDLCNVNGKKYGQVILKDVLVNPKINHNLISITKLVKEGFHLVLHVV